MRFIPDRVPVGERCFRPACGEADIVFIGPSTEAIAVMGDKITAKATVTSHGVPVVPASRGPASPTTTSSPAAPRSASPSSSSRRPVVAERECASSRTPTTSRPHWPAPAAKQPPRSATTHCSSSDSSTAPSHRGAGARRRARNRDPPRRARMQPATPTPEGDRGKHRRHCSTRPPRPHRRGRLRDRPQRRLHGRRHSGVHRLGRRTRRVLLHGDEHPAPGGAPSPRWSRRRSRRLAGSRRPGRAAHAAARTTSP